ncbi:uncharacterized protein LOC127864599 isoform X2 [Dreissena polymorpha]|uniref:Mab-21-like HhH/H2TH-like domain-containing protein n=2 Tax=Dreissena polymorpha TaxID=45954 RepID=A0A9D4NIL6_DREPO|nr:uncharacterized protein LOC127864599 isoform X2 [Dreissena polymorpha]XP_052260322.1 uncharacterized protein LOC127864599 isoform X2 [Dreissena polymorpha]KAH3897273.1 hypothetical protein DPMN_021460 [Dreissena polymorpha]
MAFSPRCDHTLSQRVARVLDDIGINDDVISKRRDVFLHMEALETVRRRMSGFSFECYHFGSQTEGTNTPGLRSDTDLLECECTANIMTSAVDWKTSRDNYLLCKESTTTKQHYLLQVFSTESPVALSNWDGDFHVRGPLGNIFLSNQINKSSMQKAILESHLKMVDTGPSASFTRMYEHGPAVSFFQEHDFVMAFKYTKPVPEIQRWLSKPRGIDTWPSPEVMAASSRCECFLVPVGSHDSDFQMIEWRLSPSLIERHLMFSLNAVQLQCYVLLKMIKESLFRKIVGKGFTSFHCKTALFFALERTPKSLWQKQNVMACLLICLNDIKLWLKHHYCPHFIVQGVNLFEGKLSHMEQTQLYNYVTKLIDNNVIGLFHIDLDNFGYRMTAFFGGMLRPNAEIFGSVSRFAFTRMLENHLNKQIYNYMRLSLADDMHKHFDDEFQYIDFLQSKFDVLRPFINGGTVFEQYIATRLERHFYSTVATVAASRILSIEVAVAVEPEGLPESVMEAFVLSLDSDVVSSRLKMAAMYYCGGELRAAAKLLDDVERRYDVTVRAVCGCGRTFETFNETAVHEYLTEDFRYGGKLTSNIAYCLRFNNFEFYCVPGMLVPAEHTSRSDLTEIKCENRKAKEITWVAFDARPFMYFLQYLTFGRFGERRRQETALSCLKTYVRTERFEQMHHYETTMSMIGYCCEVERDFDSALGYYAISLTARQDDNLAASRLLRLLGLV